MPFRIEFLSYVFSEMQASSILIMAVAEWLPVAQWLRTEISIANTVLQWGPQVISTLKAATGVAT